MMREKVLEKIIDSGAVAIIRMSDSAKLLQVVSALQAGGIVALEITMTTPNALKVIEKISQETSREFIVGVGSVLDPETARAAILAGAQFIVAPAFNLEVVELAHRYDKVVMPGCFTPTEIINAYSHGADLIKVFPATTLGPRYFKDVLGPFPQVKMMPTGGVTIENAGEWIKAGAVAVGIGSDLLDKKAIDQGDFQSITKKTKTMLANIQAAKNS